MPGSLAEYTLAHSKMEAHNTEGLKRARTWQPSHQEHREEHREEIEDETKDDETKEDETKEETEEEKEEKEGVKEAKDELKDVKECVFPPINTPRSQKRDTDDPAAMKALYDQQRKLEDNKCLLAELARIEQELRESLQREEEKQKVVDQIRQEENRIRWRNLCFLSLSQRTTKAFVSSYYKNIPMHIYCLPITTVAHKSTKRRKRKVKK